MATLPSNNFNEDDEEQQPAPTQPQTSGVGDGIIGGGQGAPAAGGGPQRRSRTGGYVGIQNYLGAQGDAGSRLAGKVGGAVTDQTESARAGVGNVQTNFTNQANESRVGGSGELAGQLSADPTQINQGAWEKATGGYKGPRDITQMQGYGQAAGDVNRAQQSLANTATSAGQNTLLRDQFGKPQYTGGQSRLDTAILGAAPGSRERFANLRQTLGGQAQGSLDKAASDAQAMAEQYGAEGLQTGQELQTALTGERSRFQSGMQKALEAQQAQEQSGYQNILKQLGAGGALPTLAQTNAEKQLQDIGLSTTGYAQGGLSNAQKAGLLKLRGSQKFADIATDEQRARDAALAGLGGGTGYIQGQKGQTGFTFDSAKAKGMRESNLNAIKASAAQKSALALKAKQDAAAAAQAKAAALAKTKGGQAAAMNKQLKANPDMQAQIKEQSKKGALVGLGGPLKKKQSKKQGSGVDSLFL